MPVEQPDSVPWFKDPAILAALGALAAGSAKIIQMNFGSWITAHTGLNLVTWTADNIVTWFTAGPGVLIAIYFIHRRIRHGKDVADPAPLVTGGAISQALIGTTPPPVVHDELAEITKANPVAPAGHGPHVGMTDEELLALIQSRMKAKPAGA